MKSYTDKIVDMVNARLLARHLRQRVKLRLGEVKIEVKLDGDLWPRDAIIERAANGFRVTFSRDATRSVPFAAAVNTADLMGWLAACDPDVKSMNVVPFDGNWPSAARFASSARPSSNAVLIPDPYFYSHRGFAEFRAVATPGIRWSERSPVLVWRGGLNGMGRLSFDRRDAFDESVIQRLRMLFILDDVPQTDVRFVWFDIDNGIWKGKARAAGLMASPVPEENWINYKFAIDIDGWTNTWSNFFVRLLLGCCVFKIESQFGFRQWYYDRIRPWEHFIPVKADMTDLVEKIDWARSHPAECEAIAAAGQDFAMALDFEAAKRDAVEAITTHWDK